jgi:hypothetical protein
MNGMNEDVRIAQVLGMSVIEYHELLAKMERLNARDLNAIAMQLLNRAVMKMENGE